MMVSITPLVPENLSWQGTTFGGATFGPFRGKKWLALEQLPHLVRIFAT